MEFAISHLVVIVPMAKQLEGMAKKKHFSVQKTFPEKEKLHFSLSFFITLNILEKVMKSSVRYRMQSFDYQHVHP